MEGQKRLTVTHLPIESSAVTQVTLFCPKMRNICTIDLKKESDLYLYWLLTYDFFLILSTPNIKSASLLPSKIFFASMAKF